VCNLGEKDPRISWKLKEAFYVNARKPKLGTFMGQLRLRFGRKVLQNRLQCMKRVSFEWLVGIDKHALQVKLKKTFKSQ